MVRRIAPAIFAGKLSSQSGSTVVEQALIAAPGLCSQLALSHPISAVQALVMLVDSQRALRFKVSNGRIARRSCAKIQPHRTESYGGGSHL